MDLIETAGRWTAAWRDRDPAAVAAAAATLLDPDTPEPVGGEALAAHVETVLARFPDLELEFGASADAGDAVVVTWTFTGTHRASYLGIPATGGTARVTGADVLTLAEGAVHVRRLFDRVALAESLEHAPRFVPGRDEVREYGTSARTGAGKTDYPRAITLTYLDLRDHLESPEVDLLSTEVVKSLRASQGFLGVGVFDIGDRKYTLTAFDRLEAVRAVHARPHQRAMRKFFRSGLCSGAYTSVWTLERESFFLRCAQCAEVVDAGAGKSCACGATHTPDPLF